MDMSLISAGTKWDASPEPFQTPPVSVWLNDVKRWTPKDKLTNDQSQKPRSLQTLQFSLVRHWAFLIEPAALDENPLKHRTNVDQWVKTFWKRPRR